MTDADLLEYIERTPELEALVIEWWGPAPHAMDEELAQVCLAFLAHEQRILAQRGTEADEGRLWSFCRKLLDQGGAISRDYIAGQYGTYEEYSARLDEAARERGDELTAMLSAAPKPLSATLPQTFDCHFDGDTARCDKDCAQLRVCKRRTSAKPAEGVQEGVKSLERECDALTDRTIEQRRLIEDLASMCRRMSYALNRAGGSDTTVRQCIDLLKRHDLGGSIIRTEQVAKPTDSGGWSVSRREFARILTSTSGHQVVAMVRSDDDGLRLVLTASYGGAMVDMSIEFNDGHEEKAYGALAALSDESADVVIRQAEQAGLTDSRREGVRDAE